MFVYIRSTAFVIVVSQKLVFQQSKKCFDVDTALYQFLETGASKRTHKGRDQLLKFYSWVLRLHYRPDTLHSQPELVHLNYLLLTMHQHFHLSLTVPLNGMQIKCQIKGYQIPIWFVPLIMRVLNKIMKIPQFYWKSSLLKPFSGVK